MQLQASVKVNTEGFNVLISEAKKRRVTLKGVKAGIRVLQGAAKAQAPYRVRSRALKQAQGVKAKTGSKGKTVSFAVQGARRRVVKFVKLRGYRTPQKVVPANYDHLVQGGTKPHRLGTGETLGRIAKGRRKAIKATSQTTGGQHPGTKANPYRMRAYRQVKGQIEKVVNLAMRQELNVIVHKQAAKLHKARMT